VSGPRCGKSSPGVRVSRVERARKTANWPGRRCGAGTVWPRGRPRTAGGPGVASSSSLSRAPRRRRSGLWASFGVLVVSTDPWASSQRPRGGKFSLAIQFEMVLLRSLLGGSGPRMAGIAGARTGSFQGRHRESSCCKSALVASSFKKTTTQATTNKPVDVDGPKPLVLINKTPLGNGLKRAGERLNSRPSGSVSFQIALYPLSYSALERHFTDGGCIVTCPDVFRQKERWDPGRLGGAAFPFLPNRWYGPADPADPPIATSSGSHLAFHGGVLPPSNAGLWFSCRGLRHPFEPGAG